jgi:hypothetical protein
MGILVGNQSKLFCLPLSMTLQDGVRTIFGWKKPKERQSSHVVQVIEQAIEAAKTFGKSILLLDRYFLTIPLLKRLNEANQSGDVSLQIVTKARSNVVAYELLEEESDEEKSGKRRRGRPRKKGDAVKLKELFDTRLSEFQKATVTVYGKEETIRYLQIDLMWGQGLYQILRFVLVLWKDRQSILVSTDLTLEATEIMSLYGYRFKTECMFREMKQSLGAFGYKFWTKFLPKLNRRLKKDDPDPLEQVTDEDDRAKIHQTVKAIEGYVTCACIATGLLQLIALRYSEEKQGFFRYLRTFSGNVASEATVMAYLRKHIFWWFAKNRHLPVTQIIRSKQEFPSYDEDLMAS